MEHVPAAGLGGLDPHAVLLNSGSLDSLNPTLVFNRRSTCWHWSQIRVQSKVASIHFLPIARAALYGPKRKLIQKRRAYLKTVSLGDPLCVLGLLL